MGLVGVDHVIRVPAGQVLRNPVKKSLLLPPPVELLPMLRKPMLVRPPSWAKARSRPLFVRTARDVAMLLQHLRFADREFVVVLGLDDYDRLLGIHQAAVGGTSQSMVEVKHVLKVGAFLGAPKLVLVHNHPSATYTPSSEDNKLTLEVAKYAACAGMELVDHVIIGDGYFSYLENEFLPTYPGVRRVSHPAPAEVVLAQKRKQKLEQSQVDAPYGKAAPFVFETAMVVPEDAGKLRKITKPAEAIDFFREQLEEAYITSGEPTGFVIGLNAAGAVTSVVAVPLSEGPATFSSRAQQVALVSTMSSAILIFADDSYEQTPLWGYTEQTQARLSCVGCQVVDALKFSEREGFYSAEAAERYTERGEKFKEKLLEELRERKSAV